MKALVKKYPKEGLWLDDIPKPGIGPNDVLLKIRKVGICGTDIHIYKWDEWAQKTIPVPMQIGHEFVGEIVEMGEAVTGLFVGERVSGEGHIYCGHCRSCRAGRRHLCMNTQGLGVNRPGCFAEFLAIPASNVLQVPAGISDDQAAILDPLGNAVHTALSYDLTGEDVLVTGAGPFGLMASAVANKVGARNVAITDTNEYRLDLAKKLGTTHAYNIKTHTLEEIMRELDMHEGFDVGLEMSGNPEALRGMVNSMRSGGKIALLGIIPGSATIPWDKFVFRGLQMKGIYGREIFETWYKIFSLLQSGLDISPLVTQHFPAEHFDEAFQIMATGRSGKVVLDWTGV
jgi:threonine 3-dehydrogenase